MTQQEVVKYWLPATRQIFGIYAASVERCMELDNLLGVSDYHEFKIHGWGNNYTLSEDMKKLLVLLASPHGKTILKMYRIRKGLE